MRIHLKTPQGKRILFISFRRPPLTPKTITLMVLSSVGLSLLFFLLPLPLLIRLFIIDICTFPVITLFVYILTIPTILYHEILIARAVRTLRRHAPMKVIGITGSFGKTSTIQFLSSILSTKFNVLSTEGSKNSPIAIAETVLKKLRPDHEIFVVEMGAYKQGEIARMAHMVEPEIGIVTAVNAQHQDLFGSIETTMKAKYELIEGLTGMNIAIFNKDNVYTKQMSAWAVRDGRNVWEYTTEDSNNTLKGSKRKILRATNIKASLEGLSFLVSFGALKAHATVSIIGKHQVSNILASLSGALACGVTFNDAVRALSQIQPVPNVMEVQKGVNGTVFINDTFNNNPDAARAALDVLAKTRGKKYLVFQPMIELGSYAGISHEEIGKQAAEVCDDIILTNANYYESFQKGATSIKKSQHVRVLSVSDSANRLKKLVQKGDTVLFKGKEAEAVFQRLIH